MMFGETTVFRKASFVPLMRLSLGYGLFLAGRREDIHQYRSRRLFPISGIEDNRTYTSASIVELEKLPRHLVIVGGGYIGLEFASMFAGFGSKVTILEAGEVFIPREDRDIADSVKSTLEKKGITIHLNTVITVW